MRRSSIALSLAALALALVLAAPAQAKSVTGTASYYGLKGPTASGGKVGAFTAASPSLPLGSEAKVTNLKNDRSVDVRINDRGPFTGGRVIDVSPHAAKALGFRSAGTTTVKVKPVH